jgi:hypothetical protein
MSARLWRMAARLWPDSLFRRLAIILFAGLLAAHVLSFGLVALKVFGPSNEVSDDYFIRWVATAVAILDRVEPEERPAWLDRLARPTYRYVLRGGGEVFEPLKRRGEVFMAGLRAELGAGHDANFVYSDPPKRSKRGMLIHLKDGSPLTIEYLAQRTVISPWLPTALAVQLCLLAFLTWIAVKLATQPLVRLERAANSLGSDLRGAAPGGWSEGSGARRYRIQRHAATHFRAGCGTDPDSGGDLAPPSESDHAHAAAR